MIKGSYLWESVREIAQLSRLKDRMTRLVSVVMFVGMVAGFVVCGSWCLKRSVVDSMKNRAAESWPVAIGKVTESTIKTISYSRDNMRDTYAPQILARFQIAGKWYSCREVYFGYGSTSNYGQVSADVAAIPTGGEVKVSYNPRNPNEAILRPGLDGTNVFFMAVGVVMLGIGLLLGIPLLFGKPKSESSLNLRPESQEW
jgi:hypothetical protein